MCGPKSAFSIVHFQALWALGDQRCLFSGIFFTGRPMPSHISCLCYVLSPLGLSTLVSILISLSRIILLEISLLEVEAVVLTKVSGARLKLFLLHVSIVLVLPITRAICPSSTGSVFLSIPSVVSQSSFLNISIGFWPILSTIHLASSVGNMVGAKCADSSNLAVYSATDTLP